MPSSSSEPVAHPKPNAVVVSIGMSVGDAIKERDGRFGTLQMVLWYSRWFFDAMAVVLDWRFSECPKRCFSLQMLVQSVAWYVELFCQTLIRGAEHVQKLKVAKLLSVTRNKLAIADVRQMDASMTIRCNTLQSGLMSGLMRSNTGWLVSSYNSFLWH